MEDQETRYVSSQSNAKISCEVVASPSAKKSEGTYGWQMRHTLAESAPTDHVSGAKARNIKEHNRGEGGCTISNLRKQTYFGINSIVDIHMQQM